MSGYQRFPDAHGCMSVEDHEEYIEDRRQMAIANLTLRQRVARHWAWFWDFYVWGAVMVGAFVVVAAVIAWWLS